MASIPNSQWCILPILGLQIFPPFSEHLSESMKKTSQFTFFHNKFCVYPGTFPNDSVFSHLLKICTSPLFSFNLRGFCIIHVLFAFSALLTMMHLYIMQYTWPIVYWTPLKEKSSAPYRDACDIPWRIVLRSGLWDRCSKSRGNVYSRFEVFYPHVRSLRLPSSAVSAVITAIRLSERLDDDGEREREG